MQVLVARQEAEEIIIDLDTLMDLTIIPLDFPLPQNHNMRTEKCRNVKESYQIKESTLDIEVGPKLVSIQERQGSVRSAMQFNRVNEETIDEDLEIEKLRKKLLKMYAAVFKRDLGPDDRVDMDLVKVELVDSSRDMGKAMIGRVGV